MNIKDIEAFAKEAAKSIKTPEDLNQFSQMLKKITVEAALNAEMDEHLGYEKNHPSTSSNSRNGKTRKRIQTEDGQFELNTPRDREGSFEPQLVKKHQSRFTSMDDKILWLYSQGMSTRDIVQAFDEWYGADISPTLVSRVTNAVIEQVVEWQSRPLDAIYLDCIVIKIRQDKRVISKSIFLVLGGDWEGVTDSVRQVNCGTIMSALGFVCLHRALILNYVFHIVFKFLREIASNNFTT